MAELLDSNVEIAIMERAHYDPKMDAGWRNHHPDVAHLEIKNLLTMHRHLHPVVNHEDRLRLNRGLNLKHLEYVLGLGHERR